MSSAFDVTVIVQDDVNGRLVGPELERVAKLLSVAQGVALFDLESEGRLFARCQLKDANSGDALSFSYESESPVDALERDPNKSYR